MPDAALVSPKGFSHLAIRVTDLGRSVAFYSRVLGFDVFDDLRDDPRLPRVFGTIGGTAVELVKTTNSQRAAPADGAGNPPGLAAFAFAVEDMDATFAALKAQGLVTGDTAQEMGRAKLVWVRDPDGTMFELIELPRKAASMAELAPRFKARRAASGG
ncbi:MAG: VOC family protein [Rhizomicrobium sp.]|jgi:catechol 2,3-dioxygenase-like lactoylglutathione lyase family enzyme